MEKQVLNKVKGKRLYTKLKRNLSLSNIMSSSVSAVLKLLKTIK